MKNVTNGICALLISAFACLGASGQTARTVYIDAAANNGPANWNNLAFSVTNNAALLKDSQAQETGIRAAVTAPLNPSVNGSGTTAPSGAAAEFAPAGGNSVFGHALKAFGSVPVPILYGEAVFSNLNPAVSYSFTFFASRVAAGDTANRETLYTLTGANSGSAALDCVNNTANVAAVAGIQPTAAGVITLRIEAGPANNEPSGFFYIGSLKITYDDPNPNPGRRLLFFGNSFSIGDNVPGRVAALAVLDGQPAPLVAADLMGGKDLAYHIGEVDANAAANVDSPLLSGGDTWDDVIMQGYSTEATHLRDTMAFRTNALALYRRVKDHASGKGAGVRPVLFQTWARAPGHSFYPASFPTPAAMQHEIRTNYQAAAESILAAEPAADVRIAPVGDAFERGGFSPVRLYAADLYHAGNLGPALAALVLYKTLYGTTVTNIPYDIVRTTGWTDMSSNDWERVTYWAEGLQPPAAGQTARTAYIDAVGNNGPANWNNLPFSAVIGSANATLILKDSQTNATGIRATLTSRMDGVNSNATPTPTGDAAEFAPAGNNNCHGHPLTNASFPNATPLGELTLSNLNPSVAYDFTFYASRMGVSDRRTTLYTATGANSDSATLNASGNTSNVVTVAAIRPTPDGVITVRVEAAPDNNEAIRFYYLAAMKIAWTEPPPRLAYVDADANDAAHPLPVGWNLLDMTAQNGLELVDAEGAATGIKALVSATTSSSDTWSDYTPTGAAAEFAPAWRNGAYAAGDTAATFTLHDLVPDRLYTFTFFANRHGGTINDKTTRYIVTGANVGTNELNATTNTSNVAVVADIRPRADRTIQVVFRKGTGNDANNNYLTAWKLSYPETGLAAPEPPPIAGKRILLFGNQVLTAENIPVMLANLAEAAGHSRPLVVADVANNRTLAQSTERVGSASLAYNNVIHPTLTGTNTWDEVVIAGALTDPTHVGDPAAYRAGVAALWNAVKNHASGKGASARAALLQGFARGPGHSYYPDEWAGPAAMQAEIDANTQAALADLLAADPASGARLAPVGAAYAQSGFDPATLYAADLANPSQAGPELIALVLYKTLYGGNARDVSYDAANAAGVNAVSEPDWLKVTHWADGLAAPAPQPPAPGAKRTWLIDAASNASGSPSYLGWNYKTFNATGVLANLVYTNGAPSGVSLEVIDRMTARNDNSPTSVSGDAAIFAKALWNNAYGNIGAHSTYSNEFCTVRFSGLVPSAAYTFTLYGSRAVSGSRETKYIVEGATSGEALLEAANNTSNVAVIPKIRPRPDGTLDLKITAGPNNTTPERFYHLNALMFETGYSGTLLSVR
jgi:hypothetical protein